MSKVALVICPPFWLKTPSLGLEYIKNYSKNKALIDIFDLNIYFYKLFGLKPKQWLKLNKEFEENLFFQTEKRFKEELKNIIDKLAQYDYIGFSLFKRNLYFSLKLSERVKNKSKNAKIIFGGPQLREEDKKTFPDSITVEGEGEIPLLKIIQGSKEKKFFYEEVEDLDSIPFLKLNDYHLNFYNILPLLSSRGCIRRCKFCSEWNLYKKFRQHSYLYMVEQIEYLINKYNINQFSFQDSLINADLKWLENFCKEIISKNLNIKWEAQIIIRPKMKKDLFKLMKKAGCFNLFIGLESGSERVLEAMHKGFNLKEAQKFFTNLKETSVMFEVSIIIGYPSEREEDFKETLSFLKKNKNIIPKIAQISTFIPYKNSLIYKEKPELLPNEEINRRLRKIIKFVEKEKIPHKKAFIDNLRYKKRGFKKI